jgi:hypothetical protein
MWRFFLGVLWLPGTTLGDELIFKNGDRLTGTLISAVAGKLTFDSRVVGKVTASVGELESLTTDEEIEIHLKTGAVVSDRITARRRMSISRPDGSGSCTGTTFDSSTRATGPVRMAAITRPPIVSIAAQLRWIACSAIGSSSTVDSGGNAMESQICACVRPWAAVSVISSSTGQL